MNTTNQVAVSAGVAAYNEQGQKAVEAQVIAAIRNIKSEQATIKTYEEVIAAARVEAKKVELDVITDESVLGTKLDTSSNPNAVTMANAIAELNKARQENVKAQTLKLTSRITDAQAAIKACNERIAKIQADTAKLTTNTVTVSEVMGNE